MSDTIYQDHGYRDRDDYLHCLCENMGVPMNVVSAVADLLGPNEDFDGLVTTLEDYEDSRGLDDFF
jgi:hypothetical protein